MTDWVYPPATPDQARPSPSEWWVIDPDFNDIANGSVDLGIRIGAADVDIGIADDFACGNYRLRLGLGRGKSTDFLKVRLKRGFLFWC
jgi:hypothetical protein